MISTETKRGAGRLTALLVMVSSLAVATAARAEDKELHIFNWTSYTAPDLIAQFEKETGIKVVVDTYDSNETLMAKLSAGSSGYDIAVASADFVPVMIAQKLIQPIDAAGFDNYGNLAPEWKTRDWDPGNKYSVVWNWGTTSAMVDAGSYKGPTDSLALLFDPPAALRDKIGMSGAMSEVISLALVYLGRPQCTSDPDDLKALSALLETQKPAVKVYDASGVAERLGSGEVMAAETWSGAAYQAHQQRPGLQYVWAKEGVYGWADNAVVPATAQHPENAKAFLNFLLKPENAATLSNFTGSQNGVTGSAAFMTKALVAAPEINPPAGQKIVFGKVCPEASTRAYDRIWTRVRG